MKETQSQLENGIIIDAKLPVGSTFPTQWGDLMVVKHVNVINTPSDGVDAADEHYSKIYGF